MIILRLNSLNSWSVVLWIHLSPQQWLNIHCLETIQFICYILLLFRLERKEKFAKMCVCCFMSTTYEFCVRTEIVLCFRSKNKNQKKKEKLPLIYFWLIEMVYFGERLINVRLLLVGRENVGVSHLVHWNLREKWFSSKSED